jgi:hypothetical protein
MVYLLSEFIEDSGEDVNERVGNRILLVCRVHFMDLLTLYKVSHDVPAESYVVFSLVDFY